MSARVIDEGDTPKDTYEAARRLGASGLGLVRGEVLELPRRPWRRRWGRILASPLWRPAIEAAVLAALFLFVLVLAALLSPVRGASLIPP